MVVSSHPGLQGAVVNNLFRQEGGGWDMEILEDMFGQRDRNLISKVPSQLTHETDQIIWHLETSGLYTVKSAYMIIQQEKGWINEESITSFWKRVWTLKIPPKVKNMIWRAGTFCLPTMTQLITKKVAVNVVCPICNVEEEIIFHCLVTCQDVKCCWDRVGIGTHLLHGDNFLVWLKDIFERLEPDKRGLIATLCWAIWNARNEPVWKKKKVSALDIVASAKNYLNQWRNAQNFQIETPCPDLQKGDGAEHWTCPPVNSVKINIDAAIFEIEARSGMGVVARDDKGTFLEGFTKIYSEKLDPPLAETLSMREALSWLMNKNWQQVFLETDCLTVVKAIRSHVEMLSCFGIVIRDCRCLLKELKNVSLCFVKRLANMVVHSLARASICYLDRMFSLENVSAVVLPHLVANLEG
uniref:RNase H type-1 domain-containing protein n=1 Tax=Cannabis sativa TaxID=3483 RepID=A0A803NGP8_CANSA